MSIDDICNNKIILNNYVKDYIIRKESDNLYIFKTLTELNLFQKDLSNSELIECVYNHNKINCDTYKFLLTYLYKSIDSKKIIQNTILNNICNYNESKSDQFLKTLCSSINKLDERILLKEIINMSRVSKCSLELKIKLNNDEIYWFKIVS